MTKLYKNDFSRVVPGPLGSSVTNVESVKLRRIFFIFGQLWASLGIREIGEKLTIFAKMSVTKVRFFHSALRASRTPFRVEEYFEGILHTFKAP